VIYSSSIYVNTAPTDSNQVATKAYVDAASGGKAPFMSSFTANGTWVRPSSSITMVWVTICGGGGGGGSGARGGGGGGGAGYSYIHYPVPVSGNVSVTVGGAGSGGGSACSYSDATS